MGNAFQARNNPASEIEKIGSGETEREETYVCGYGG
jgi:hypothetical protein